MRTEGTLKRLRGHLPSRAGVTSGSVLPLLRAQGSEWQQASWRGVYHSKNHHPTHTHLAALASGALQKLQVHSTFHLSSPSEQVRYWLWPFSRALTVSRAAWARLTK